MWWRRGHSIYSIPGVVLAVSLLYFAQCTVLVWCLHRFYSMLLYTWSCTGWQFGSPPASPRSAHREGEDTWRTYGGFIEDIWRTYGGHVEDICRTYAGHMEDIWRTYGVHMEETWRTYGGNTDDTWRTNEQHMEDK